MRHAKVYIAGRSETKANPVIQELQQSTGNEAIFLTLDLADLASIRRCAKEFLVCVHHQISDYTVFKLTLCAAKSRNCTFSSTMREHLPNYDLCTPSLFMLGAASGVLFNPIDQLTADGYDLTFGTNVLGK